MAPAGARRANNIFQFACNSCQWMSLLPSCYDVNHVLPHVSPNQGESLQPRQLDATHWVPELEVEVWRRARDVVQV